jgi:membrane protease YdiL (CAAX protease family)
MQTPIGLRLHDSPRKRVAACVVGVLAVSIDLSLSWGNYSPESLEGRWVVALAVLVAYLHLTQGDLPSLGLTAVPAQGWGYWGRMTFMLGLAVAACIAVGLAVLVLAGRTLPMYVTPPSAVVTRFLHMCVFAPVLEEMIYRLAVCVPLAALRCPWGAVVVSGLTFGGLHVQYGNPSPENLVGGFVLAWSFLKSGTIYVPVLLHSLGNLCALAGQLAGWYWLGG